MLIFIIIPIIKGTIKRKDLLLNQV